MVSHGIALHGMIFHGIAFISVWLIGFGARAVSCKTPIYFIKIIITVNFIRNKVKVYKCSINRAGRKSQTNHMLAKKDTFYDWS